MTPRAKLELMKSNELIKNRAAVEERKLNERIAKMQDKIAKAEAKDAGKGGKGGK